MVWASRIVFGHVGWSCWGVGEMFWACGFEYSDAYLSAAVIASSLCLSMSYYYTVYGARPARLPSGSGLLYVQTPRALAMSAH